MVAVAAVGASSAIAVGVDEVVADGGGVRCWTAVPAGRAASRPG